jgi:hypothetical protein
VTDRLKGLVVTFDRDIREDDAKAIVDAIKMIRGVLDATPSVRTYEDHMNRARIDAEWRQRMHDLMYPSEKKESNQ